MSESKKYVTFRDLKDLGQPKKPISSAPESSTSTSSTTRLSSSTSTPQKEDKASKLFTVNANRQRITSNKAIAPDRDFQRVPNSITRDVLQEGLFRGKSKQVWDYMWSISRGAVIPMRIIRKSRKEIKAGSGLGSMVTVDAAIDHLKNIGLLTVRPAVGSLIGNEYEIFMPEELELGYAQPTSTSSTSSTSSSTSPTQKVVVLDVLDSSISSTTQPVENTARYERPNTFINTIDDDDDTHTLLSYFSQTLLEAAREIVGGKLSVSEQERVLWNECACVLVEELRTAAVHAESISSVPAFFASHLRRRFAKKTLGGSKNESAELNSKSSSVSKLNPVQSNKESSTGIKPAVDNASRFSPDECRRYAEHLKQTGQGITNPGGYATKIFRSGEADALIEAFLATPTQIDISQCPDCRGSGFIYIDTSNHDKGVRPCKHLSLSSGGK